VFCLQFITFTQLPTHLTHHYLMQGGDFMVKFSLFILDMQ